MRVISFKNTGLFKLGIWLSAATLIAFAVIPSALDGSLLPNPASGLFPAGIVGVLFFYFLWKTQFHRLADEVVDCVDHLQVQTGGTREIILFSNISAAEVSSSSGLHRITVRLLAPTKLGKQIDFLPQASLWSNLAGIKAVAINLTERAQQANVRAAK